MKIAKKNLDISAPGKLMLAGEWVVLELGNPCIVMAVDKRVHVQIKESDEISISLDDFKIREKKADFDGRQLIWREEIIEKEREKLVFIKGAIETALQYLEQSGKLKPFKIRTFSEESQIRVDRVVKKIGFGSSAAAAVATIAGLLSFYNFEIETKKSKEIIYKLATIAHYFAQGKVGSAFDIAASTYGGIIVYKRFDPD